MSTVCRNGMEDALKALEGLQNILQGLAPVRSQTQLKRLAPLRPSTIPLEALPTKLRAAVERLPKVAAAGFLTAVGELSDSGTMLELEYRVGVALGKMLAAIERDEMREDEYRELNDWILSLTLQRSRVLNAASLSNGNADLTAAALSALLALGVGPQPTPRRLTAVFNTLRKRAAVPVQRSGYVDRPDDLYATRIQTAT